MTSFLEWLLKALKPDQALAGLCSIPGGIMVCSVEMEVVWILSVHRNSCFYWTALSNCPNLEHLSVTESYDIVLRFLIVGTKIKNRS